MSQFKSGWVVGLALSLGVAIAPACVEEECLVACLHLLELDLELPAGATATSVTGTVTYEGIERAFACDTGPQALTTPETPLSRDLDPVDAAPFCEIVDGVVVLGGIYWDDVEEIPLALSVNEGRHAFEGVVHPTHHEEEVGDGCRTCPKLKATVPLTARE